MDFSFQDFLFTDNYGTSTDVGHASLRGDKEVSDGSVGRPGRGGRGVRVCKQGELRPSGPRGL